MKFISVIIFFLLFSVSVFAQDKYSDVSQTPQQNAEAKYDRTETGVFGFNTGGFSLNQIRLLLPSYIEVTPESQLTGDMRWNVESFSQFSLRADGMITSVRIRHPGLSDRPIDISNLEFRGFLRWNRSDKTLYFHDVEIGRKGVMAKINGQVSYANLVAVNLTLSLPTTPIQKVLDAIPADLIPKIQGAMVAGTISMDTVFAADPQNPQNLQFVPGIQINDYALLSEPTGVAIKALKTEGSHQAMKNGVPTRKIYLSPESIGFVTYDQLGEPLRNAILKSEDISFMSHRGFNLEEIRRTMRQNLTNRKFSRGASTITMQLAKNLYLDGRRTLSRKLQEAMFTYALEQELSKQRILEIYANIIEWGVDVYGIAEASTHYFSKSASALTPEEAAFLASVIPSPQKRDIKAAQQQSIAQEAAPVL